MLRRRTLLEPGLPVAPLARRAVGAAARALGAPVLPAPVLRALRPATALERLLTLARTAFALALEPPPAGAALLPVVRTRTRTSFVALVTAAPGGAVLRTSFEAPLTLPAAGRGTTGTPVTTRPAALTGTRTTRTGRTSFPALAALATGSPLSRPSLTGAGTVETALAALPAVITLPAVIALAASAPLLALATTGTTAPALRATGARSTAAGATALAGSGGRRSLTAAGVSPTPRRRVPPPVVAPPLAAVVAAAVLFRAHHVRHCSRWKFGGLFTLL
ncbi:hypothetical protein [Actinomadura sp. B10D3]|uniref:hypothetical protein n=1 Tax=Actinomadura sp. B10D3 TaxID=3153557 RepID=UPI00325EB06E